MPPILPRRRRWKAYVALDRTGRHWLGIEDPAGVRRRFWRCKVRAWGAA